MAKLSFLEIVGLALFTNVIMWQATSSISLGPSSSTVTEETLTTTKGYGCDGKTCPPEKSCNLSAEGKLECICKTICAMEYAPVCGSDGKTYSNECVLKVAACLTNTSITVTHDGKCKTGYRCNMMCTKEYAPVCGSDGTTYGNRCLFNESACQTDYSITLVHDGECKTGYGCHGVTCPPDKFCQMNRCICNTGCTKEYVPVCGSDGTTYGNMCLFNMSACQTNYSITLVHEGECKTGHAGCYGITCPPGRHCVLNTIENRLECLCDEACPLVYAPVCGSDGQNYGNDCLLGVEACRTNTYITIKHWGSCDSVTPRPPYQTPATEEPSTTGSTCNGTTCPPGNPCPRFCPALYDPVCGSDGKTYSNECTLLRAACTTNTNITVQHNGSCDDGCTGFECPFYGQCSSDAYNRPTCVCLLGCPKIYRPVCGSNSKTYSNECELQRESCLTKIIITVLKTGSCDGGSTCNGTTCPPGEHCPRFCPAIYDPVCGSDGKTYSNGCALQVEACTTNTNITVQHNGSCDDVCTGFECPFYGQCSSDGYNRPKCVCLLGCIEIYDPVCGSNSKTYTNDCELRKDSCQTQISITVLHPGKCDGGSNDCDNITCPLSIIPVCGSDNQTYAGECELRKVACQTNTNITVLHPGQCHGGFSCVGVTCPPEQSCEVNSTGQAECICNITCTRIYAPVCGSDGKTYDNECMLRWEACSTNTSITMKHKGICNDTTVRAYYTQSTPSNRRTKKPRCRGHKKDRRHKKDREHKRD